MKPHKEYSPLTCLPSLVEENRTLTPSPPFLAFTASLTLVTTSFSLFLSLSHEALLPFPRSLAKTASLLCFCRCRSCVLLLSLLLFFSILLIETHTWPTEALFRHGGGNVSSHHVQRREPEKPFLGERMSAAMGGRGSTENTKESSNTQQQKPVVRQITKEEFEEMQREADERYRNRPRPIDANGNVIDDTVGVCRLPVPRGARTNQDDNKGRAESDGAAAANKPSS